VFLEFINDPKLLKYIDEHWNKVLPHILDYNYTIPQNKIDNVSKLIRKEYIGSKRLIKGNTEQFIQVLNLYYYSSDSSYLNDIFR